MVTMTDDVAAVMMVASYSKACNCNLTQTNRYHLNSINTYHQNSILPVDMRFAAAAAVGNMNDIDTVIERASADKMKLVAMMDKPVVVFE